MQKSHQILKNIRAIREKKGLSQYQIAKKIGITQSKYARFESEGKKIDYKLIEKLAELFDVSVVFIINYHVNSVQVIHSKDGHLSQIAEGEKIKISDPVSLQTEIHYLKKLNDQLTRQLKDKEEIIQFFKEKYEGS